MAMAASDTNLADSVASHGLFKPTSQWISILPPLDFVNMSSIIPDVCFRSRRGASSTTNMESVSAQNYESTYKGACNYNSTQSGTILVFMLKRFI